MALTPEVQLELERLCNAGDSGDKLVRSTQEIMNLLRQHGLAHEATIPPKMVGVHCSNREGYGLNVMDVKELMEGILSVGFVASRVQAVCVELESADRRLSADFNEKLLQSAGGALGQQDAPLKYASLAGSHTNFVLRLFLDSVRCDHPEVAVDGALCLQRLKAKDIALYNACMQGLRWEVISAVVAKKVPKVLELVQRAGNTTLHRPEHELQVMLRMHALWRSRQAAGAPSDYSSIRKQASRSAAGACLRCTCSFSATVVVSQPLCWQKRSGLSGAIAQATGACLLGLGSSSARTSRAPSSSFLVFAMAS